MACVPSDKLCGESGCLDILMRPSIWLEPDIVVWLRYSLNNVKSNSVCGSPSGSPLQTANSSIFETINSLHSASSIVHLDYDFPSALAHGRLSWAARLYPRRLESDRVGSSGIRGSIGVVEGRSIN
jgi:hypothetical protein